jgi:hypothetical protein
VVSDVHRRVNYARNDLEISILIIF